jgi:hypothetical protein
MEEAFAACCGVNLAFRIGGLRGRENGAKLKQSCSGFSQSSTGRYFGVSASLICVDIRMEEARSLLAVG